MPLTLIWAQDRDGVIGLNGGIPWRLPEDLAHFKALTLGHPVIMGRVTWDSLAPAVRPLPGRRNIVVTRNSGWNAPGAEAVAGPEQALQLVGDDDAFCIGGAQLYAALLPLAQAVELTEVDVSSGGDAHAPVLGTPWQRTEPFDPTVWLTSKTGLRYRFCRLERSHFC
ncbi:MAG: dihydrofolate reductase [Microbacteriaceae bacterium]|nr:dihydrofolate reductase [Microbacteriaceae bacterium]MCI1207355.1 dihydrofolate reductase [Microbacteriaceae bacterium]